MSSNPSDQGAQAAPDVTAQAATATQAQAAPVTTTLDTLPDWAQKELKQLRANEAKTRIAEKQRSDAELTEAQKLKGQLDELLGANTSLVVELRGMKAQAIARDAGALYPDVLADRLSDEAINGDKAARDKEIDKLKRQYPGLFRSVSVDGGAGKEAATSVDMNQAIRAAAGRGR